MIKLLRNVLNAPSLVLILAGVFVPVSSAEITHISAGNNYTCVINDGAVECGGENTVGQLDVPLLAGVQELSAGARGTVCAISEAGLICWGRQSDGLLDVPMIVNPLKVSVGNRHACALGDEGVRCWGLSDFDQLNVPELTNVTQIAAGDDFSCALADGGIQCWGADHDGSLDPPAVKGSEVLRVSTHACAAGLNPYSQKFSFPHIPCPPSASGGSSM